MQDEGALLRHEQQFPVRVHEIAVGHRRGGRVQVHGHPGPGPQVPVPAHGVEAVDEIHRAGGQRQRVPAQPVGVGLDLVERRAAQGPVADPVEARVRRGRHDPVDPGPPVDRARLGEGGPAQLLGIQAERRALRRVAAGGQGARDRFSDELVAEARLIVMAVRASSRHG